MPILEEVMRPSLLQQSSVELLIFAYEKNKLSPCFHSLVSWIDSLPYRKLHFDFLKKDREKQEQKNKNTQS
jgi:hypothetical protein